MRTTVADAVHSGNGRTALADDNTDYYPVPLKQETLRPGTIYADPYGHVLVIAKRIAQTRRRGGRVPRRRRATRRHGRAQALLARQLPVRAGSRARRPRLQALPADRRAKDGGLRRLTNDEIAKDPQYADFSLEQSKLGVEDFYDRMDDVMSPAPLDPLRAMKEAITALEEQAKTRVTSVENGRKYQGPEVAMPDGRFDLRDDRRVGGLRDAVARSAPADRDRRGAHLSRSRRAAARALCDAEGQERRRREGRDGERARLRACGAQVYLYAQRRLRNGRSRSRT